MQGEGLSERHRQVGEGVGILCALSKEAAMNDYEKRQYVLNLYPDRKRWKKRVEAMPMGQVLAIYQDHSVDPLAKPKPQAYYVSLKPDPVTPPINGLAAKPRDPHWNEDDFPLV